MICPACSKSNPEGTQYCGACGQQLPFSASAGAGMGTAAITVADPPQTRQFCGRCGSELRTDGSCFRCAVPRVRANRTAAATPAPPVVRKTPAIPPKTLGLAAAAILVLGLGLYTVKAAWGESLLVQANIPGATVLVDGVEKATTPAAPNVPVTLAHLHGKVHTISLRMEGYQDIAQEITMPLRNGGRPLPFFLQPKPVTLQLQAMAGSQIFLNGQFVARTDSGGLWISPELRAERYVLAVRLQGFVDSTQELTLKPGEARTVKVTQVEAPLTADQINQILAGANQKFMMGQYEAADADCEMVLKKAPGNEAAVHLRDQITAVTRIAGNQ